jgi:hypothetical protein
MSNDYPQESCALEKEPERRPVTQILSVLGNTTNGPLSKHCKFGRALNPSPCLTFSRLGRIPEAEGDQDYLLRDGRCREGTG